ncbi:MAG: RNA polymerase sigma-70 factor [Tenacibaculum sp.]
MSSKKKPSKQLLLSELHKGNQKAFKKLFELYWEPMFVSAKTILGDQSLAKDIVQDIWIGLWQHREHTEIKNFEAYIFNAVKKRSFKYFRDKKLLPVHLEVIETLQPIAEPDFINEQNLEHTETLIEQSLNKLPKRCKQIFELSRMQHYSNEEIAIRLGVSKRTVENQISLAIKSIRTSLISIFLTALYLQSLNCVLKC